MYRLSSIIIALGGFLALYGQSPHGDQLALDCALCHNPGGWEVNYAEVTFDHDNATTFPLEGTHSRLDCKLCHESLIFEEAQTGCISCHEDIHSMSVGNDCARCHDSESWLVDNIPELHEENGFPLMGAHGNLSCVECHTSETNLRFDRIGNECISCHMDDYAATDNPPHQSSGFSTNCEECHNPLGFGWEADPIAHDFFPLVLGHDINDCSQCHTTGNFSDANPDCFECHQTDFQIAANPPHQELGFPTDCKSCHTLDPGWMPATFDIHDEYYPLHGAHADIATDCDACHQGNYTNTPNTCFGCHEDDYNRTDDPNHAQAGFSTDCAACHSEDAWEPADFDHDGEYFPIYSGEHRGEWDACTDCHNVAGNYAIFTCFTCHGQSSTDREHREVGGYSYNSNECYRCHPNGRE